MKKYNAAIVGCGRIGFGFDKDPKRNYIATHAGAYNFLKQTSLAAACDLNEAALKECVVKYSIPRSYTDVAQMLRSEHIDILSICTPPHTHYSVLKEAVQFPLKAIFCEKPLAGNLKEAQEMVRLCKEKNILLQVDHQRRFDPLHIQLQQLVRTEKLGCIQQANFYYSAGISNTGSHMFDLLRFLFGEVEWVEAFLSKNVSGKEGDQNLDGILKFKNGLFTTFQAFDVTKYLIFELSCFFDKGQVVIKDSGFTVDFYKAGVSKYFSGYKQLLKASSPFKTDYKRNFMVNALRHLISCIETAHASVSSGLDGYRDLALIEASIVSANNNGKRIFVCEEECNGLDK